jgi:hypothetical protein
VAVNVGGPKSFGATAALRATKWTASNSSSPSRFALWNLPKWGRR